MSLFYVYFHIDTLNLFLGRANNMGDVNKLIIDYFSKCYSNSKDFILKGNKLYKIEVKTIPGYIFSSTEIVEKEIGEFIVNEVTNGIIVDTSPVFDNGQNKCYWVKIDDYYAPYYLVWDIDIKKYLENNNLTEKYKDIYEMLKDVTNEPDALPSYYVDDDLLRERPDINIRPVVRGNDLPTVINDYEKELQFEETVERVYNANQGDCWGIFTMDRTNYPKEIFFDRRSAGDYVTDTEIRNKFADKEYIRGVLANCIKNDLILCIVFNELNFYDYYFYPNKYNSTFDYISLYYQMVNL